jgi:hypothetical protein
VSQTPTNKLNQTTTSIDSLSSNEEITNIKSLSVDVQLNTPISLILTSSSNCSSTISNENQLEICNICEDKPKILCSCSISQLAIKKLYKNYYNFTDEIMFFNSYRDNNNNFDDNLTKYEIL